MVCQTEECQLYADDTCLTYVHEDLSELTRIYIINYTLSLIGVILIECP